MKIIKFFNVFEMVGINGSLILNFLPRMRTSGSLIVEFLKLQNEWSFKESPNTGYNSVVKMKGKQ
jgi:hypothetical protein